MAERLKIKPEVQSFVDENHSKMTIEIALPGVAKENIKLRMHQDSFSMIATREKFDYVTTMAFCCPVKPEDAKATYDNGLLTIHVPFKDLMEDALRIPIE